MRSNGTHRNTNGVSWRNVSRSSPCPKCGKPDWCTVSEDGDWCNCRRVADGGAEKADEGGCTYYVHRLTPWPARDREKVPAPRFSVGDGKGEKADPDVLHKVYTAFLARASDCLEAHGPALRKRGFPPGDARDRGYATLGKNRVKCAAKLVEAGLEKHLPNVPGFVVRVAKDGSRYWSVAGPSGLLIPSRDPQGRVVAVRVRADDDGEGGKYRLLSSKRFGGPGPGSPVHHPLFAGDKAVSRVTEGALKADLATALSGVFTIGLPSVNRWRLARKALAAAGAKTARVAYDADCRKNRQVAQSLECLLSALVDGGLVVELEVWPIEDGKGIDDVLAAGKRPEVIAGEAEVRSAVAAILAEAEEADPPPRRGGAAAAAAAGGRLAVEITPDEHLVVAEVTAALAADDQLFQRDGVLVRPWVVGSDESGPSGADAKPRALTVRRPAGLTVLRPASPWAVRERIVPRCFLYKIVAGEDGPEEKQCHPPEWLAPLVLERPGSIRQVEGILPGPTIDTEGRLINARGYDAESRWFLARDLPGLAIPESPGLAEARKAADMLGRLVEDFPFVSEADRARWLTLLLTACARHLIDRTPIGLINANTMGSGKTLLSKLISIVAHGTPDAILMSWPEGSELQSRGDEVRKRLASLLHESASLVILDNLPRGTPFGCTEVDAFVTADSYTDRQLGRNDGARVGGRNRCLLLATGNNVWPAGDTADRALVVSLSTPLANPRSRRPEEFAISDLEGHAMDRRGDYLSYALTVWRAWILAGCPTPRGEHWGSFERFVGTAVAVVRWLGWPDPIEGRVARAEESDVESRALMLLLTSWCRLFGEDPVGATQVVQALDGERPTEATQAAREALAVLGAGVKWPPNPVRVGSTLKAHQNRVAEVARPDGGRLRFTLRSDYNRAVKVNRYYVTAEQVGGPRPDEPDPGEESAEPVGAAGGREVFDL